MNRSPVQRVLDHERRYWDHTTGVHELPDPHRLRLTETVAAVTLCGASDAAAAERLLARRRPPSVAGQCHGRPAAA